MKLLEGQELYSSCFIFFLVRENQDFVRFSKDFYGSRQSFHFLAVLSKGFLRSACRRRNTGLRSGNFAENRQKVKIFEENRKTSKRTKQNRRLLEVQISKTKARNIVLPFLPDRII